MKLSQHVLKLEARRAVALAELERLFNTDQPHQVRSIANCLSWRQFLKNFTA